MQRKTLVATASPAPQPIDPSLILTLEEVALRLRSRIIGLQKTAAAASSRSHQSNWPLPSLQLARCVHLALPPKQCGRCRMSATTMLAVKDQLEVVTRISTWSS